MLLVFLTPGMRGDVTYSYCGYNSAGEYCPATSLVSEFVQASFTVKNPLPANATEAVTPESYEMGTVYSIYPTSLSGAFWGSTSIPFQPTLTLDVSTDSAGNIVDWYMVAEGGDQQTYGSALIETCNNPALFAVSCPAGNDARALDYFQFINLHGLRIGVDVPNDPGIWTTTVYAPEPGSAVLVGMCFAGFLAVARRRSGSR